MVSPHLYLNTRSILPQPCSRIGFSMTKSNCSKITVSEWVSEWFTESHSVVSYSSWPHGLYSLWNSPGQNTGMGSLSLLQGIFPMQGLNLGLPHCRWILYQLSHEESPGILEWVACPFPSGSSWPRDRTGISCIAGGFFTNWAIREAQKSQWRVLFNSHNDSARFVQIIELFCSYIHWTLKSYLFPLFIRIIIFYMIILLC